MRRFSRRRRGRSRRRRGNYSRRSTRGIRIGYRM